MKKIRTMVNISGLVQGVSFRYFTVRKALEHNVTGWVRNLPNGNVQGCFEGKEADVKALIDWCHIGPGHARVENVSVQQNEYTGEFRDFQVR